jgi:PTS system galactitol-specific IIA component
MLSPDLCVVHLAVLSGEEVVRALAALLLIGGHVKPSFEKAAIDRERRSPTGLPFAELAVALPHAEPEHVLVPAIAVASLATPVTFRQMGSPNLKLDVSIVVMPALSAASQAAAELSRLIQLLQDDDLRRAVVAATTSRAMYTAFAPHFQS